MEISADSSCAYEEDSTTHEERRSAEKGPPENFLPPDAWALVCRELSLRDIVAASAVCRNWRTSLHSDRIWRILLLRFGIPIPPSSSGQQLQQSLRQVFVDHAASVTGPTLAFRAARPELDVQTLPSSVAEQVHALLSARKLSSSLVNNHQTLLLNDEFGLVTVQLTEPFRIAQCAFEVREDDGTPVPMRRSWTDGTHVVVQSQFVGKSSPMPVAVYSVSIKSSGSGVSVTKLGTVGCDALPLAEFPYLMTVFFGKTFFLLELNDALIAKTVVASVPLSLSSADTKVAVLDGSSLSGGQPTQQLTMPASAYSDWKYCVLRKFPDAPVDTERERLFVYDALSLRLLHDYTAPTGERWRYPFIRKMWCNNVLIESHSFDGVWSRTFRIGGPLLLPVWRRREDENHLQRHVPGAVLDETGSVFASLVPSGKSGRRLLLQYFAVDGEREPKGVTVDAFDCEVERKCVRLHYGTEGCALYFFGPFDVPALQGLRPKLQVLQFRSSGRNGTVRPNKSAKKPSLGTELMRAELMQACDGMSLDDLLEMVKLAREKVKNKR